MLASVRFGEPKPSAEAQRPRAVVVVADMRLASFLDRVLAGAGYVVERLLDSTQVSEELATDVVLLEAAGARAEQLRARTDAPIVVLAPNESVEARVAALDAGADDVLSVAFDVDELLARLRALRRGRALASAAAMARARQGVLSYADVELDLDTREVTRGGRRIELRHKAFELLACFMRHPQRVMSRRELLEDVWGYDFLGDSNVIEVTISTIRQALEAGGEPRLICTVRPIGYMLKAKPLKANGASYNPRGRAQGPSC